MSTPCDSCGENAASIFFKADVEGRQTKMSLCEECARQKGLLSGWSGLGGGGPLGVDLAELLGSLAQDFQEGLAKSFKVPTKPPSSKCPRCGTTFASFKSTSFVGCADCYETFMPAMKEVVRRIHGTAVHKGKPYVNAAVSKEQVKFELARLKQELDQAIRREAFEQAALLRDRIKKLEAGN